jgi:hypothetical protein
VAITLHGQSHVPVDNDATGQAGPSLTITQPGSMLANDYVVVLITQRTNSTLRTLSVSNAGGQTWVSETQLNTGVLIVARIFHCRFNGTWSASPSFQTDSGTTPLTGTMLVFRGVDTTTALDVAIGQLAYAAPTTPFDVTIPDYNTATANAMAVAFWTSGDDNTWTVQTGGWTQQTPAQTRNLSGSDASHVAAWKTVASAGAVGAVTNRQTANGGDSGTYHRLALKVASGDASQSAPDTETLDYSEAATLAATASAADTQALTVAETATFTYPVAAVDAQALTVVEEASVALAKDAADEQAMTVVETAIVSVAVSSPDTETLDSVETATLAATALASDSQDFTASDTATLAAALDAVDTQTLDAVDTATVGADLIAADTQDLTAADAASSEEVPEGDQDKSSPDAETLDCVDTADVSVAVEAVDSQALTASDEALLALAFTATDAQLLTALESMTMIGSGGATRPQRWRIRTVWMSGL